MLLDVAAHLLFGKTDGRDRIALRPKTSAREIAPSALKTTGYHNGALALDEPDDACHFMLRRNAHQYMHMVGHNGAFPYLALLLPCQFVENRA